MEKIRIPELTIEPVDAECSSILLEQDSGGNIDRIEIHQLNVRLMAERFGLVPASDPLAASTIATPERRLHALSGRVTHLANYLANHSDSKHADLSYEQAYASATADIAEAYCSELTASHTAGAGDASGVTRDIARAA